MDNQQQKLWFFPKEERAMDVVKTMRVLSINVKVDHLGSHFLYD